MNNNKNDLIINSKDLNLEQQIRDNYNQYNYLYLYASDNNYSCMNLKYNNDINDIIGDIKTFKRDMESFNLKMTQLIFSNQLKTK